MRITDPAATDVTSILAGGSAGRVHFASSVLSCCLRPSTGPKLDTSCARFTVMRMAHAESLTLYAV